MATKAILKWVTGLSAVGAMVACGAMSRGAGGAGGAGEWAPPDVETVVYEGANVPPYLHSEGIKAYGVRKDSAEALSFLRHAVEADSLYAPAWYAMARIYYDAGQDSSALPLSGRAVALDSTNVAYKSQLGQILIRSGMLNRAQEIYTELTLDDPHNIFNYGMLAAIHASKGQVFTAITTLDSAEYKLGRHPEMTSTKRMLLIQHGLYDRAAQETRALIAEYPYDDENYAILGDLYGAMGRDSLAMANYKQALSLDSTNVQTLSSLAGFYEKRRDNANYLATIGRLFAADDVPLERKKQIFSAVTSNVNYYRNNYFAISSLASTLLAKYPDDYSIIELYATHLARTGFPDSALELYKSYIATGRRPVEPYLQVIAFESYLQHPDSVARYSDMALTRFPGNADVLILKGYALNRAKDTEGAERTFREALRGAGSDSLRSAVTCVLADIYAEGGKARKAFALYDKALRLDLDNSTALNNYAYYLGNMGTKLDKAAAMSARANALSPGNASFLDTEAWILYKLGRYEEAKEVMMKAISYDSADSAVLLLHYGDIFAALGDRFMAEIYWRRAMERGHDVGEIEQRLEKP